MVTLLTRPQAEARRRGLLQSAGMTREDLAARASRYELTLSERAVADEVEGLDYLLDGSRED